MLHYLTIGFLDEVAVQRGSVQALKPLTDEILSLMAEFADSGSQGQPTFEGETLRITKYFIKCPWYAPSYNRTTERFALAAKQIFGCVVADIKRGQLIEAHELESNGVSP